MMLRSPSSVSLSVKFTDASLGALMPNMPLTSGSVFPPALLCRPHFSHSPWSPGPTLLSHSHAQSANLVLKEGRCEVSLGGSHGGGGDLTAGGVSSGKIPKDPSKRAKVSNPRRNTNRNRFGEDSGVRTDWKVFNDSPPRMQCWLLLPPCVGLLPTYHPLSLSPS